LSEVAEFSSKNIRTWLESETSSIFNPVHAKAQKLLDEMRKTLDNLADSSRMLLDNSGKEIEKRNMKTHGRAKALNKLARLFLERMQQLKIPELVSYDSVSDFSQETQKALLVTEVDIRNWFPRISPFFILDRRKFLIVFEKTKELLKELIDFVSKEYIKTKTLEDTFHYVDELRTLEEQLLNIDGQKKNAENEKASIEKEIAETQQKMVYLKSKGEMSQLNQIGLEMEKLRREVKHNLRHLKKPLIKFQRLTFHKGGLTQEESRKLDRYIENPFDAFATEEVECPILKQILRKMSIAMSEGKLKLKRDKKRKAEQAIEDILHKNSLISLYQKCASVTVQRKRLSTSEEVVEAKSDLSDLKKQLEDLERRKEIVEAEENVVDRSYRETMEKIQDHKKLIEKNAFDFTGKRLQIE